MRHKEVGTTDVINSVELFVYWKIALRISENDNRPQCCIDHDKYFSTCDTSKIFKDQIGNGKVFLIPTNDEVIKPTKVIFEGE